MASIFTYQDKPPRIHSPWSSSGTITPQSSRTFGHRDLGESPLPNDVRSLEPERQDGPVEYKLHLLLRLRRKFSWTSTNMTNVVAHYQFSQSQSAIGDRTLSNDATVDRPLSHHGAQVRQNRLQQLTTQLLWRLQQSSPFHSSSNADLVLPLLPEATPSLGLPDRPAKLLPGLEESQGALYEIGVADNGTLLGLVEDELQESLGNLQAMAASLGCTINVLRKLVVGTAEWLEPDLISGKTLARKDDLWVAEVLVFPDTKSSTGVDVPEATFDALSVTSPTKAAAVATKGTETEQMRVSFVGASASGKSSLIGTLSTSTLDNGRGKSRLSLLKHRHEITSGVTSSVAHELIGYRHDQSPMTSIINYATGDVSTWVDIHNLADRLILLSDTPGLARFAKSAIRGIVSWKPSWTVLCVAADTDDETLNSSVPGSSSLENRIDGGSYSSLATSQSYLDLCLRLNLPMMIVITKLDLANRSGLRLVLTRVLSSLKAANRTPVMLSNSPAPTVVAGAAAINIQAIDTTEQVEINRIVDMMRSNPDQSFVPILLTSAIKGTGIDRLHVLLRSLQINPAPLPRRTSGRQSSSRASLFHVDEVFSIPPSRVYTLEDQTRLVSQGIVLCGYLAEGKISIGDTMLLGPFTIDSEMDPLNTRQSSTRSKSYNELTEHTRLSQGLARSCQPEAPRSIDIGLQMTSMFLPVQVVSVRTLRLPVMQIQHGETGTIGVEPAESTGESSTLAKARKGMILTDANEDVTGYQSFSAEFPASDFARTDSPVLILGGHALVYVNSMRAAVKVTSMAPLYGDHQQPQTAVKEEPGMREEKEIFHFDSDDEASNARLPDPGAAQAAGATESVRLTFRFVSTVEWLDTGDEVLVVPTLTAAGPVAGPVAGTSATGLSGYVGIVCALY